MKLLRGRWLYVVLAGLVLLLYGQLIFNAGHRPFSSPVRETAPAPRQSMANLEIDGAMLLKGSSEHPRLAWLLMGLFTLGLSLGVWGLWLNARAIATGKIWRVFRYRSRLSPAWSLGEAIRVVLLVGLVASLLPFVRIALVAWGAAVLVDDRMWTVIGMLFLHLVLVFLIWGFAANRSLSFTKALGLTTGRRAEVPLARGLAEYGALFPWLFGLLWLLTHTCQRLGIQPPIEPIQELLFEEPSRVVVGLTIVMACVIGPIVEEMLFRGVLFTALRRRTSRLAAMLISGSMFSAAHTNVIGFVPIVLLGCLLADVYERTGSLWSSIAIHAFHNTLLVAVAFTLKGLLGG